MSFPLFLDDLFWLGDTAHAGKNKHETHDFHMETQDF